LYQTILLPEQLRVNLLLGSTPGQRTLGSKSTQDQKFLTVQLDETIPNFNSISVLILSLFTALFRIFALEVTGVITILIVSFRNDFSWWMREMPQESVARWSDLGQDLIKILHR